VRAAISLAALLALASACVGYGAAPANTKFLRIGVDLPLTGGEAPAAVPALNGIRFYVSQHPTLGGFQVQLAALDDATGGAPSPEVGAANVQRFVADSNLVAMLGPFDSAVARKEIPIANTAGLAMVTPATSSACLTRDVFMPALLNPAFTPITCRAAGLPAASELRPNHVNNFFRLSVTDELQGAAAADYAFGTLHLFRAAVISDGETYGQGLADAFRARLTRLGGQVVAYVDLDPTTSDPKGFLEAAKAAGAQAVYYGGVAHSRSCALRAEMKAIFGAGEAAPLLAGDGLAQDPVCIADAGDNGLGIYATVPIIDADAQPEAAPAIRAFKSAYGQVTDYGPYTMPAYDATAVLYSALGRGIEAAAGGLPTRPGVISQLAATTGFLGVTEFIGFDKAGDTTNRQISVFESVGSDPRAPWRLAATIDYTGRLPY